MLLDKPSDGHLPYERDTKFQGGACVELWGMLHVHLIDS